MPGTKRAKIIIEIILSIIVIIIVLLTTLLYQGPMIPPNPPPPVFCQMQSNLTDSTNELGVEKVATSSVDSAEEYVGLSNGNFAFETSGPDGKAKCFASQALNQHKIKEAEKLWNQAMQSESNDAEVLIYQENQRILDTNPPSPYISIIVGVAADNPVGISYSGTFTGNSLDILQGVYVAQKRYNQDHASGLQIRVIIANFGTGANANLVARQIITATQKDNSIKAMVNLPSIADTSEVINTLSGGDFPIVLPTGSTGNQENRHNFFHIEATATEQGQQAAKYVEKSCPNQHERTLLDCKGINIAAFIDTNNNYSSALGSAFTEQLTTDRLAKQTNKVVQPVYYDSANPDTLLERVNAFGNAPPDLIYFAGDAINAEIMLKALPQTGAYANLRILGGDALYQTGRYTGNHYDRLNFTAFAYPDEWAILNPGAAPPEFFCDYARDFAGGEVSAPECSNWQTTKVGRLGYRYSRPENDVVLAYDAMDVILVGNALSIGGDISSREQLLQSISSIDNNHPFEGVSGQIAFGPDGNPIHKAILVLRVDEQGYTRLEQQYGTF